MKRVVIPAVILALAPLAARADALKDGQIITLNDNASWCWFQDERVVSWRGKLYVSSVASQGGPGGAERSGNIEITTFEPYVDASGLNGKSTISVLHAKLQEDDHDAAGMMVLPDGRFLAMYSKHMNDKLIRFRVSTKPGDATAWEPEQIITRDASVTYNNLHRLAAEGPIEGVTLGRIYDFYRGEHYKPNVLTSDDNGKTWAYGGQLVRIAADPQDKMRPYARYASNNRDTIWIANTDAHPAEYPATSLYLMYMKGGKLYHPGGKQIGVLDPVKGGAEPADELCIFKGDRQNQAWVCQIQLDKDGKPCVAYSVHKTDEDLRYRYYDGTIDIEIARAGTFLYKSQEHYTGNIAVDPADPHILYFSTNVDPTTGEPLISKADGKRHWELFKAEVSVERRRMQAPGRLGGGSGYVLEPKTTITPITQNSTVDNLRPIVPAGDGSVRVLVWLRGTYTSYTRWNLAAVAASLP
jgi:hypothetical protein